MHTSELRSLCLKFISIIIFLFLSWKYMLFLGKIFIEFVYIHFSRTPIKLFAFCLLRVDS